MGVKIGREGDARADLVAGTGCLPGSQNGGEAVSFKACSVLEDPRARRAGGGECDGNIGYPE